VKVIRCNITVDQWIVVAFMMLFSSNDSGQHKMMKDMKTLDFDIFGPWQDSWRIDASFA
jgi:hypothetical protein